MLRKIGLTVLLIVAWLGAPMALAAFIAVIIRDYPPASIAVEQSVEDASWDEPGALVKAHGTWVLDNEQIGSPLNEVEIACHREWGTCLASTAELMPNSGRHILVTDLHDFPISSWTHDAITFGEANGCTRYTVTVSRRSRSVTAFREPDPSGSAASCFGPAAAEMRRTVLRSSVQDSWPVYQRLQDQASQRSFGYALGALLAWSAVVIFWVVRVWRSRRTGASEASQAESDT